MDNLEEIKSRLDIVEFISQYLPVKKAGRNFRTVCPFHSDKDPSLIISPDKQIWHCFGCGEGGDIFSFLMKKEGLSFPEALNELANRAGVQLKTRPKDWGIKSKLFAINDLTNKFFQKYLSDSAEGRKAENYLIERGVNADTIKTFDLGYAPAGWDYLLKFLERREYSRADAEKAGVASNRGGKFADKFRHRLMFPITDVSGKVVGFTGRVLDPKNQPKYLNTPETPIFNKGRILYGLSVTKEFIQKTKTVILVEGQMDVLASFQAGVQNVLASSGTALTSDQLKVIRRFAETLILAMDADSAGGEATKRAIILAQEHDIDIKVAILEGYKDPDECIKADPDKWKEAVDKAVPIVDFYTKQATEKHGLETVSGKKKVVAEVLPIVSMLDSPVEKDQYIKKLSMVVGVDTRNLYEALAKTNAKIKAKTKPQKEAAEDKKTNTNWLEKRILGMLLHKPNYLKGQLEVLDQIKWPTEFAARIYEKAKNCYTAEEFSLDSIVETLEYQDKVQVLELILTTEEYYADMPEPDVVQELKFYINLLKQRQAKSVLADLNRRIAEAEKVGDKDKLEQYLKEFNQQF
ncbi:MAG: DNA primase [Patescibacteria group bacterium]|nr:DNA primase [Patescibacteria group bacterium]